MFYRKHDIPNFITDYTLLVRAEPRQSMTALDVKFSLAISSRLDH